MSVMPSVRHHESDGQKPLRARSQALGLDGLSPRGLNKVQAANRHYESYQLGSTSTRTSFWLPSRSSGSSDTDHCPNIARSRNRTDVCRVLTQNGCCTSPLPATRASHFGTAASQVWTQPTPFGIGGYASRLFLTQLLSHSSDVSPSPALSPGSSALVRSSAHDRRARSRVRFLGSTSNPLSCNSVLGHLWNPTRVCWEVLACFFLWWARCLAFCFGRMSS